MLGAISKQLVPGFGILLLLCMISLIALNNKRYVILFCIICLLVDIVHEGKIFTSYAILCLMFYFDEKGVQISIKRVVTIGMFGLIFLLSIFIMRAYAVGDNNIIGIYSAFSEFMGVNATAGWAIEYASLNLPNDYIDFDAALREYYLKYVGHGLALSPVAYFIGNFHSFYYIAVTSYCIIILFVYLLGSKLIGKYSLLIFMYNIIHLLRHGPNLFLTKSITQIFIISLVFILIYQLDKSNSK